MLKIVIILCSIYFAATLNPFKNNNWIKKNVERKTKGKSDEQIKKNGSKLINLDYFLMILWIISFFTITNLTLFIIFTLLVLIAYFVVGGFIFNFHKKRDPLVIEKELEALRANQPSKSTIEKDEKKDQFTTKSKPTKKPNKEIITTQTDSTQTDKKAGLFSSSTHCPHCRSLNVSFMQNNKKGFSVGKAVGGAALTGGIGTLAGFVGKKGKNQWHCQNCGKTFETKK